MDGSEWHNQNALPHFASTLSPPPLSLSLSFCLALRPATIPQMNNCRKEHRKLMKFLTRSKCSAKAMKTFPNSRICSRLSLSLTPHLSLSLLLCLNENEYKNEKEQPPTMPARTLFPPPKTFAIMSGSKFAQTSLDENDWMAEFFMHCSLSFTPILSLSHLLSLSLS